jgi:hypothetical protein
VSQKPILNKPELVEETRAMLEQAKADVDAARRALDALR